MGGNYRELAARASHVLIAARNAMLSSQPVSDAIVELQHGFRSFFCVVVSFRFVAYGSLEPYLVSVHRPAIADSRFSIDAMAGVWAETIVSWRPGRRTY